MTIRPVRLQLCRRKGFNLQALSRATNGLEAVNVARPGKWGNWYRVGLIVCGCRTPGECNHNSFRCATPEDAVKAHRATVEQRLEMFPEKTKAWLAPLRGNNVACFCAVDAPWCHGDTYLELANA